MCLIFLTPLVQPFRNKRRQVTLVFNRALNQHSARGSFTHSDTSVWKVPQRDQCDLFFFFFLQETLDLLLQRRADTLQAQPAGSACACKPECHFA